MAHYSITNPPTKTLERGDTVVFTIRGHNYEHTVESDHLSCSHYDNSKVFELLGLDRYDFAKKAYGYESSTASLWPEFRSGDFEAATRIVWHLFVVIACGGAIKRVGLSHTDYADGKIKVYTEDGVGGGVDIWLEDSDHCAIRIAEVTTEGRKDGKAFLKLISDNGRRHYSDRVAFSGNRIEFQV